MMRGNVYKVIAILALCFIGIHSAWAEKFSIVVLPDTQSYSAKYPDTFKAQTQWIVDNQADGMDGPDDGIASNNYPIIYVAHLGDMVSNGYCKNNPFSDDNAGSEQWANAVAAMDILKKDLEEPSDDIPHGVLPGNHDFDELNPGGDSNFCQDLTRSTDYNGTGPKNGSGPFGPRAYTLTTYYGGNYHKEELTVSDRNDNNYTLFQSPQGGVKFIAINFAYTSGFAEDSQILTWANKLLATHRDRNAIITSHYILEDNTRDNMEDGQTVFGKPGVQIYDKLKEHPNLFLMLSGHRFGEAWRTETRTPMNEVQILLSNYQAINYPTSNNIEFSNLEKNSSGGDGDSGFMRIMRFDTCNENETVAVTTFAPKKNGTGTLESTNTLPNGASMSRTTASNFSFPFKPAPSSDHCPPPPSSDTAPPAQPRGLKTQ